MKYNPGCASAFRTSFTRRSEKIAKTMNGPTQEKFRKASVTGV
jgi:hypothetical protein